MFTHLRSLLLADLRPSPGVSGERREESGEGDTGSGEWRDDLGQQRDHIGDGWATASVIGAIRQVVLATAAGWQLVMAAATLTTLGADGIVLAIAQIVLAAVALLSMRRRIPGAIVPLGMMALALWGYFASGNIDSTLAFAACWQINFASCIAALTMLGRSVFVVVLGSAAVISCAMGIGLPEWGVQFPIAISVTQLSIVVAMRLGLPALVALSRDVDLAAASEERAEQRFEVTRHASQTIAEQSRVLHDTAINTLGAIANGTAGLVDPARVREQCARDVQMLEALRGSEATLGTLGLLDIFGLPGLPIERSGIVDAELVAIEQRCGDRTIGAIVGCVREALTNAAKHSGAELARVRITTDAEGDAPASRLVVEVCDSGRGFVGESLHAGGDDSAAAVTGPDGSLEPRTAVRGIAGSIVGRAHDSGFDARVESAPGHGTCVRLDVPIPADSDAGDGAGYGAVEPPVEAAPVAALSRRAAGYWGLGVAGVSIVLTIGGGTNVGFALIPMIALMLACWWAAQYFGFDRGPAMRVSLLIAAGVVFVLSAAATGFGTTAPVHWQALAATGPTALYLACAPSRQEAGWAAAAGVALVVIVACAVLPTDAVAAKITAVAGVVGLGFSVVWFAFQTLVVARAEAAARARRRVFAAALRREKELAAQASYRRWVSAGLDDAVVLLEQLAGGRDAEAAETQLACADEERYLRQLLQVGPELVHLGGGLMAGLHRARRRGVDLEFRMGGADAPDAPTADRIVDALTQVIAETPASERLVATLFPVQSGMQLTLLGPALATVADGVEARLERLGPLDLLELTYTGEQRLGERGVTDERSTEYRGAR